MIADGTHFASTTSCREPGGARNSAEMWRVPPNAGCAGRPGVSGVPDRKAGLPLGPWTGSIASVSIFGPAVTVPADASAAAWIAARLGEFGTVGGLVPDGFDQYLLVRPAWLAEGDCGGDDAEQTATIASVAQRHTTTTDLIRFGIWEGYGWASSMTLYSVSGPRLSAWFVRAWFRGRSRLADRRRRRRIRQGLEQVPQFDLPCRRYYLLHGQLQAAACIVDPGGCRHQVPDLWWPDDRQWFVATDTDLDWTYIAGSRTFIAAIIAAFPERTEIVNRDTPNNLFM